MTLYRNGDRCPCCGTVIQDKSREWLLEFSATVYALGFREDDGGPSRAPAPTEANGGGRFVKRPYAETADRTPETGR